MAYYSGQNYNYNPPGRNIKSALLGKNVLSRLLQINIVIFIIVGILRLIMFLFNADNSEKSISDIAVWLAVPASFSNLALKPWTIISYMFLHESFLHILFNMLILYFAGNIFMEYLSSKKLLSVYLLGGIMGAAFYIGAFNTFPVFSEIAGKSVALGASASVLAVLVATATFNPSHSTVLMFLGRIKLIYIALIFVVIDFLSIEHSNPGGHIAHLGGAFWGFSYIMLLKLSKNYFNNLVARFKSIFKRKPKMKVHRSSRPLTDDEYNNIKVEKQKKIDAILDKISKSGYQSLNPEEKEFLFKASKNQ